MVNQNESPYDGSEEPITSLIQPDKEYPREELAELKIAEAELDKAFSHLTPKHKIIYLTYTYYEKEGKYLPKRLREKLDVVLGGLAKSTIRVYKQEAKDAIKKMQDAKK